MAVWKELLENRVLLTAAAGWFLAQFLKTMLFLLINREWNWERMWGAGGMPSSHSSMVCSLTVAVGRYAGVANPLFAVVLMFAFVTVYDAMGVRRETGNHAKLLNKYLNIFAIHTADKDGDGTPDEPIQPINLKELVGHTPLEVTGGVALGLLVGFLMPM